MERKVSIKNLGDSRVIYRIPSRNVKRKFMPQATIEVPFDEIKEGLYDQGIQVLFAEGTLAIVDIKDAIELGLVVGQGIVTAPPADSALITEKIQGSNGELMKFLRDASASVREHAGQLAVKLRVSDPGKLKIIQQYTGVSVLSALKREEELNAPGTTNEE